MQGTQTVAVAGCAVAMALVLGLGPVWADEPQGASAHKSNYGGEQGEAGGHAKGGHGMMGMHSGTGHLLRHLLKHADEIGLSADQVAKVKDIQLSLDKFRIKTEADIMIAERELKSLTEDEKSDLSAIKAKLEQAGSLEVDLRLTAIKLKREALALLTPEQRAKEKAEHEKMMQQHKGMGSGHGAGAGHGGAASASPHGGATPQAGQTKKDAK